MKPLFNMQLGSRGTLHLIEMPGDLWAIRQVESAKDEKGEIHLTSNGIVFSPESLQEVHDAIGMALAPDLRA